MFINRCCQLDLHVHASLHDTAYIAYLEGQGDLVSRLIMGITRVTLWVMGLINLLTKSR